ncbi:MAG: hypothetical protein ACI906_004767, partial [Candidatus Latescibacterota bacterium]
LISHLYTADPSAHVFDGTIYIYPSHDRETATEDNDLGDQYDMVDYHVFSMESIDGQVEDHGVALALEDIPWAERQLWAPDAAEKDGTYYFYFPAKGADGIFRIGVASSPSPSGPFVAEKKPIDGSYSIDPCSFVDTDGTVYLYFGGIWGGQLQNWQTGSYDADGAEPADSEAAIMPRVGALDTSMKSFAEDIKEVQLLDADGTPLKAGDHERRFFEGPWVHKRGDVYYFSYSTGDTHYLAYATGDNPLGPFTYQGRILEPVLGWTTHHSIVEFAGRWYLFYHDASLSNGVNHLRCVKVKELDYDDAGQMFILSKETPQKAL